MTAFLGIPDLAWFVFFFGAGCLAFGVLIGRGIHALEETPVFEASISIESEPADLDDWLAETEPAFDFKLWQRPRSEAQLERRAA